MKLITNPSLHILPGENIALFDALNAAEYEVKPKVLSLLQKLSKPTEKSKVRALLEDANLDLELLEQLISTQLIMKLETAKKHQAPEWHKKNWGASYFLHLATRDMNYEDKQVNVAEKEEFFRNVQIELYAQKKGKQIALPPSESPPRKLLQAALQARRTRRVFSQALEQSKLSNLLSWSLYEAKKIREHTKASTQSLSLADSLFTPFEIYLIVQNVAGLEKGAYHYDLQNHSIVKVGDIHDNTLIDLTQGQTFLKDCPVGIIITSKMKRFMKRYRHSRAYKELFVSCGRLGHLFCLWATAQDLGSFMTPALKDDETCKLLGIEPWDEEPIYFIGVGK